MCGTATAKRRRRQAKMNNSHLAKLGRPVYRVKSATKSAAKLRLRIQREQERKQRGAKG
jgi:hypothetical protein